MKLFGWQWLVVSSLLVGALAANAETRPQYGGTLRVTMQAAPASLDPADRTVPDSFARRSVTDLIFDTLVTVDNAGRARPALAESWQSTRGNQRWQFRVRHNVKFQDGTPLSAEIAAASLRFANPSWRVSADGDSVTIELTSASEEMLAELALPRNAIVKRDSGSTLSGTGPFHIINWQPGIKLELAADENCWRGRPFLDGVEIQMGRSFHDQMTGLQFGKADLVELAPEQTHRVSQDGRRLVSSVPLELLALVFVRDAASPEEKTLREALGWSIERGSMRDVLLQGAGQPAGSLLPTWISGYGFVFSSTADLTKARQLRMQARTVPAWRLGYDSGNSMDRLLAERVALNAKDAGLSLQPTPTAPADLRLMRIPLASSAPWIALEDIAAQAGLAITPGAAKSAEDLYAAEQAALTARRVIPLFHLPVSYLSSSSLKSWTVRPDGSWAVDDAWLEGPQP